MAAVRLIIISGLFMRTSSNEYLNSVSDVTILEGEPLELHWVAHNEADRKDSCSWTWGADSGDENVILVYEDGRRHDFRNQGAWNFINKDNPCKGGITKTAEKHDIGVYHMRIIPGYSPDSPGKELKVKVINPADLAYNITVNGMLYQFDVTKGTDLTLTPIKTYTSMQVQVRISEAFSDTVVRIYRYHRSIICSDQNKCNEVLSMGDDETSHDIIVTLATGIQGADHLTITQPVIYVATESRSDKMAAAAFGFLFFLFLLVLVALVVRLILINRSKRKSENASVSNMERKSDDSGFYVRFRRQTSKSVGDFKSSLSRDESLGNRFILQLKAFVIYMTSHMAELTKETTKLESEIMIYNAEISTESTELINIADDLIKQCDSLYNKMQEQKDLMEDKKVPGSVDKTSLKQDQRQLLKQLLRQCQMRNDVLSWIKLDIERLENNSNDNWEGLQNCKNKDFTQSEEFSEKNENETVPMESDQLKLDGSKKNKHDFSEKFQAIHKQSQMNMTLKECLIFVSKGLTQHKANLKDISDRLTSIKTDIINLKESFENFLKVMNPDTVSTGAAVPDTVSTPASDH